MTERPECGHSPEAWDDEEGFCILCAWENAKKHPVHVVGSEQDD